MIDIAFAAEAGSNAAQTPQQGFGQMILMLALMFGILYLLLIRPQQKKQKALQNMINALKRGDNVLTVGGIYGTVAAVEDNFIMLKISENTKIKMAKSGIAAVLKDQEALSG